MKAQKFAVPATLFAAGAFAAPGHAATMVDISASDFGTPIDLVGSSDEEYAFYSDYNGVGSAPALQGKAFSGNTVGPVSSTPYYPTANAPDQVKTQSTAAVGYYGLRFSDNVRDYTGYALVDRGGLHISEIDFKAAGVPEPATWAMMMMGLGGIGAALRQRRRSAASAPTTA